MRSYVCAGIACVLLSSLSVVSSLDWDFKQGQTACIKVKWEVQNMDLTGTSPTGEGRKAKVEPAAGKVSSLSKCPSNGISTLNVDFPDDVSLSFTFIEKDNMVIMDGTLTFVPFKVLGNSFENITATLSMNGELNLSANDKSFTCTSPLTMKFTTATANNTYALDMVAIDSQIQAFGVTNGAFSDGSPCEADLANTTVSTEEPATTAAPNSTVVTTVNPNENKTTEAPTTEAPTTAGPTTEAPTTEAPTTASPSIGPKYYFPNETDPCIIVAGNFKIKVMYTKKDNTTGDAELMVPATAKINGTCPQDSNSMITMSWKQTGSEAMRMVRMSFNSNADQVKISTISLDVTLDNATFPDTKDDELKNDFDVNIPLSKTTGYYKCEAKVDVTLGDNTLSMTDVAIQAFNVNGSSFTGEREECAADSPTTVAPVTTPAPVTPTPGSPPTNKYTFAGNCIVLSAGLEFVIPYMMKDDKNGSVTVGIPKNFTTNGSCGNVTQMLEVTFYEEWKMQMMFNGGGSASLLADSDSFYLEEIKLTYVLQPDIFKDAKNANVKMVANSTFDSSQFSAKKTGSYECNSKLDLSLNNGVTLNTNNLQVKAFSAKNSTDFPSGDLSECPQDSDTNSVVPIAVGAALAGLVVIVLIAYLIGRRRSRSGYQQV
ncbi:lysosome-associated membrane glycoprotein 1-like [Ylistrum balloti]|uniref:lysosome-associated membrane glycoprotein 1-like n=1 Tax=Ylistrum balloti TaxID=509963 RepID=UPI002905D614|nr:lysosome-associated membrane glycoprotein 1-like [Ylistrum balloti]